MKYADPSRCPGCREALPHAAARCPHCDLVVRHPLAQQVFASLTRADELLAQLRAESAATATAGVVPPHPPSPSVEPLPSVEHVEPRGLGLPSVPKIFLGLGALCLLVAAVIFLVVSWSWLGVGGRTAVLLGLTVAAGAAVAACLRLGLRIAAEALSAVCLGLVALDVAGAENAGWLGELSGSGLLIVLGVVVTVVGSAFAYLTRPHLGAPQVAAGIGALVAYAGTIESTPHVLVAGHLVLAVIGGAVAAVRAGDLRIQLWSLSAVAAVVWTVTALAALEVAAQDPSLQGMWLADGAGWSLLATAAALVVPGFVTERTGLTVGGGCGAALLSTLALTAPAVDESARLFALVALVATAGWVGAAALLPRLVRPVALAPATAGAAVLGGLGLVTAAVAAARWTAIGEPFSGPIDVRFTEPTALTEPLVAAPGAALMVALVAVSGVVQGRLSSWLGFGGTAVGLAAVTTLASYDVPLALVSGAGILLTAAALAQALLARTPRDRAVHGAIALLLSVVGCVVALPSATLTAVAAAFGLAVATCLHLLPHDERVRSLAGLALAPTLALALWSGAAAVDLDRAWVGVPVLVALGALTIVRPRPEVEVPAAVVAPWALVAAVTAATDMGGSLALHLTVAGVLVAASGLIHPARRPLTWVGSGLLFVATWVRLGDLGVDAPEAYTLPLAVALVAVGVWRLARDPQAGTLLALGPGLVLATVPSLLWVLDDAVSLRALLLGAGCLALAVGGAALRWSAPLVVGAAVGALLVVREAAPYAAELPQWVWIGLAGALLTVVGVTWERRLHELRSVAGHMGHLR